MRDEPKASIGKKPKRTGKPDNFKNGPGKGRPKGTVNKITKAIKDMALDALSAGEGGQAFFEQRKESSPDAFMGFLKSIVPMDVRLGDSEGGKLVVNLVIGKKD